MSWLHELNKQTLNAETPRTFIYWAGILAIGAVASPNVYLNRGGVYQLSPNIYALLIARSGLGKGLPIYIAQHLTEIVGGTRIISGRNTIQSVIQDLSKAYTEEGAKGPIVDGRGIIINGEFATSLQRDPDAFTILTGLYDTHWNNDWVNKTKTGTKELIKKPCVSLFGGATLDHFNDFVPQHSLQGGFVGRCLLIHSETRHRVNSLIDNKAPPIDYEKLANHLYRIRQVKGEFNWGEGAAELFDTWYQEFRPRDIKDKTGTADRMPDHVLKVAMCISLARKLDLVLEKEDVEEAIEKCLVLLVNTRAIAGGRGKSQLADQAKIVVDIILKQSDFKISREALLGRGLGDFDVPELDRIIETLVQAKFIESSNPNGTIYYQVTQQGIDLWKKLPGGSNVNQKS